MKLYVLFFATSLIAMPAVAQTHADFAGAPDVAFDYYDLPGRTLGTIRAAMLKVRPTDPNDGQRVDALSSWFWRWSWRGTARGCDLTGATLSFSAKVRMPRLADRTVVPANVLASWDAYVATLERHESWHVGNGYSGRAEILTAIAGATCATANAAALAAVKRISARDVDYDRRTNHGIGDGTAF
ncbi:DUF922 domain-containing protein [Sphingomonas sp. GB1N7]|uniref:DUF922 domain-containing protein n=1 Tax=Parasphingomonas caseinilytica TaxID=3096158 RepID=UPI002FC7BA5F